jgi:TolB-like protein
MTLTRLWLAGLATFAFGCATPIVVEISENEPEAPAIRKLVVLPFTNAAVPGAVVQGDGAAVVTTRVLQALTQQTHFDVVPPEEAARVGAVGKVPSGAELKQQFGVDAIVTGVVRRYVERVGGPGGAMKPASVWFTMEIRTPDGMLLWTGSYDETQPGLSDDLGSFKRAWERGFRWVTAADLAGYGARQLSLVLAEDFEPWS